MKTATCHCRVCRKITSATTSLNLTVPQSSFRLTNGTLKTFNTTHFDEGFGVTFAFCGDCSSTIYAQAHLGEPTEKQYIIQVGTLDDTGPLETTPTVELNIKHRPAWVGPIAGAEQRRTYAP